MIGSDVSIKSFWLNVLDTLGGWYNLSCSLKSSSSLHSSRVNFLSYQLFFLPTFVEYRGLHQSGFFFITIFYHYAVFTVLMRMLGSGSVVRN